MANTEFDQVLAGSGDVVRSALIEMLERRALYVIESDEDPQDLTPGAVTHLAFNGVVFWLDEADATTAHDGTSCIVTADGKRFKSDGVAGGQTRHWKIQDKDLTAPPGSPVAGNSYIVAAGATGAWAGEDKHVATYTARGWVFQTPAAYDLASVIDESVIYHYSAGGSWSSGFPFYTIPANGILPSMIKYGRFTLPIENQTTNSPPGTPADGDCYVIGSSPTGAWTGKAGRIALYESSAWAYYLPYEGAQLYDKSSDAVIKYDGAAWVAQVAGYSSVSNAADKDLVTGTVEIGYTWSSTSAPTTSSNSEVDPDVQIVYSAKKSSAVLEITYQCVLYYNNNTASPITVNGSVAIQKDTDVTMADWQPVGQTESISASGNSSERAFSGTFFVSPGDTLSHTYKVRFFGNGASTKVRFKGRRMILREIA